MKAPTVLHLFAGSGGGALGFKRAGFRGVGAIDIDPAACRDLERLTGERAQVADIGAMKTPADLAALCPESPDVVFTSPPCKGFSGCLPEASAKGPKYQQLNSLAFHGLWLALEAWRRLPRLVLLENVPRIQSRGRVWLERMVALLQSYGYLEVKRPTHLVHPGDAEFLGRIYDSEGDPEVGLHLKGQDRARARRMYRLEMVRPGRLDPKRYAVLTPKGTTFVERMRGVR